MLGHTKTMTFGDKTCPFTKLQRIAIALRSEPRGRGSVGSRVGV